MQKTLLHEQDNTLIYRVKESGYDFDCGMKILNVEYPTPSDIRQFYNEYEILKDLELNGVRKIIEKKKVDNRHSILFNWFDGEPINVVFKNKQDDFLDFLYITNEVVRVVSTIHAKDIIHKDISAANILIDLQNREVCLIDFGIANVYSTKIHDSGNPELLEGSLYYMSPEQTGRMNRKIDHRSDLYSLGIVFYELLTGRVPFDSDDPLEIVHGHIAKEPTPVHVINPNVPITISEIISKLLKKNAEERYQSASGLLKDLQFCLEEFAENGAIPSFFLGANDSSGRLELPQKLYGRETEINKVIGAFESCSNGNKMLLLISGTSGTGKSAVVHEVYKRLIEHSGYFVEGKFDQYLRGVPYFAFIQAFESLVRIYLTEGEEKLAHLRSLIIEAVGNEGKVLTDIIPDLELIIGTQPPVPELRGSESQNRFNYIVRKFIASITTKDHPLVIFIDDLQWADSSSLSLLMLLMTDPDGSHLLCIGAYRNNEVDSSHPFSIKVNEIRKGNCHINELHLANLDEQNVTHLFEDSISRKDDKVKELAHLAFEKTKGNAFFVTQFLKSIVDEGLLQYSTEKNIWDWDIERIRLKNITENVVDMLSGQIQNFSPECQFVLKVASCIGATFHIEILAIACDKNRNWIEDTLLPALRKNVLIPVNENEYKFSHDKIQQSIYSLISEEELGKYHYDLAKYLLNNCSQEQEEHLLFDIVNHYNIGSDLIVDNTELLQLANLNLRAAVKAKSNSAFEASLVYSKKGISLLPDNSWDQNYETSLELHTMTVEMAYLIGSFEEMEEYFSITIRNAKTTLDKITPFEIRILAYKAENRLMDSINTGLEILELLDVKFPRRITKPKIFGSLIVTMIKLRGKSKDDILALPELTDPSKKAALRIMADIASSSYWAYPELLPMIAFKMIGICLKHGNVGVSAFAFAGYGVILCGVLGLMKMGYRFGQIGLGLLEKYDAKEWKAQIYDPVYALINNWSGHVRETFEPLQESYHIGLETGEIEFACINTNLYCTNAYLAGVPLKEIEEQTRSYSNYFKDFQQMTNYYYNEVYRQSMLNMMGQSENPVVLTGEAYNEELMLAQNKENSDHSGTFFIYFNKLILNYHFGNYQEALNCSNECEKLYDAVLAKFEIPNHVLYKGLALVSVAQNQSRWKRIGSLFQINICILKLRNWSRNAPENFKHKHLLLRAEKQRMLGRIQKSRTLYDLAILNAAEQNYINEEALACELAARSYHDTKHTSLAEYYYKTAYNKYREWGAEAKMRLLESSVPHYLTGLDKTSSIRLNTVKRSSLNSNDGISLDNATLIKALTNISKEVKLERLMSTLIRTLIENAGAQMGYLFLQEQDELFLEANFNSQNDTIQVLEHIPIQQISNVPKSLIQYVLRTGENVVIHDSINDSRFNNDPYIQSVKPKSILCIPMTNMGNSKGIIYLENNLVKGAFTNDRIGLLTLLSGQMAVSIDNSKLYNNLEQKVSERTEELHKAKAESDRLLLNILPAQTVEELKQSGKAIPRMYEKVTVLFTDFVGFTSISSRLAPEDIVSLIDQCFTAFDRIVVEHNIEKIKTIGDAYMAVGGLPVPNSTHATDCASAAIAMRNWMDEFNKQQKAKGMEIFEIRIGLHTGPVVAGIVGSKKFAFDIWGDTVNTASRMESSGEAGKVNISHDTYVLLKEHFNCTHRGKIYAKNKGEIDMYFLNESN